MHGFDPVEIPGALFDFQAHIVDWALRKGRGAIFADTGLGKTLIQLAIADNVVRKTNKKVLLLTPLAVAYQFLKDAPKIGVNGVYHSRDGSLKGDIIITNYERLHYFNSDDFVCVMLDESSILKNFDGAIKNQVTNFIRKVKYRFLSTATPSPNDFVELGTSSEALGYMGYVDMLGRFFTNNEDTIKPQNIGTKWILKGHAVDSFFQWVAGWSVSIRKPSDLGFDDTRFNLPELKLKEHPVKNVENLVVNGQIQLFNQIAKRMQEVKAENRVTIPARCEKAVELANGHDISVYWTNFNKEADLIEELDAGAIQVKGSMKLDKKEEILIAFQEGQISKLITKPKITAFGLNWQHCQHTVYFPTFSYEQYYQAIRRFWRFGQKKEVIVDLVFSDGQKRVLDSLKAKTKKANQLFTKLNEHLNGTFQDKDQGYNQSIQLPKFM